MDALLKERRTLKGKVTRIYTALGWGLEAPDASAVSNTQAVVFLDQVRELRQLINKLQDEIGRICDDADYAAHEVEFNQISARVDVLEVWLNDKKQPVRSNATTRVQDQVRLPKIDLPTFSGNLEDWLSFHDLFVATVHNNKSISGAQKLQYLKVSLRGEAANLIQSVQITDENYDDAWNCLLSRYQNKREIIKAHVKRMFTQSSVQVESPGNLRKLLDVTAECVRALKILGAPTEHWDIILEYLVTDKLDSESRRQWELSLKKDNVPTFSDLSEFLDTRARALAAAGPGNENKSNSKTSDVPKKSKTHVHLSADAQCPVCGKNHPTYQCDVLFKMTLSERQQCVRKNQLCFNCLGKGHSSKECKRGSCKKCQKSHHTLLHEESRSKGHDDSRPKSPQVTTSEKPTQALFASDKNNTTEVLLMTALVNVLDKNGEGQTLRALLDPAAQASFITEHYAQKLGLNRKRTHAPISGLGKVGVGVSRGFLELVVSSRSINFSVQVEALVMPSVTGILPHSKCDSSTWTHIKGLQLADPNFGQPGPIDLLLGADVYADALLSSVINGEKGTAIAINTKFGWVLTGRVESQPNRSPITVHHAQCDLDAILRRFWEVEELPSEPILTKEEKSCEEHFASTHSRDPSGRYVVQLPFKEESLRLGKSRDMAIQRFKQIERRLATKPDRREEYVKFMSEYESLGHMEEIAPPLASDDPSKSYYIPHHYVLKESSTTTKFRVVFDASAKTSNGISLNQNLMVGPKLQDDLVPILIRFRTHAVALSADIRKMYRQILVDPIHSDFQRIVWRESPDMPIRDYKLKTVTYGTAAAPYQATKCLQQLAHDEQDKFPIAATVATRDFYVDDLMSGDKSTESALVLQDELIQLAKCGQFELCKWSSNDPALLESLPPEYRETQLPLKIDVDESIKTLGIRWNPGTDEFSFVVNPPAPVPTITKRSLLSDLAKTFDPLGWLSPVTIKAKILFQSLWRETLSWDDPLPEEIAFEWSKYCRDLSLIEEIKIPRCITPSSASEYQIHGFSDASESAYSAVVYMRSIFPNGEIEVNLVMAKTKVAPTKTLSIPRLELCGAFLLAKTMEIVNKSLRIEIKEEHSWTDSTDVLSWVTSCPSRWKTFVANRVSQIQELTPSAQWHFVPGRENPADCASRGLSPSELKSHPLWWTGPPWLRNSDITFSSPKPEDLPVLEAKSRVKVMTLTTTPDTYLMDRYSSWLTLRRVSAMCLRFIHNCKSNKDQRKFGFLNRDDLHKAQVCLIKIVQYEEFKKEVKSLQNKVELPHKSKLRYLDPFLDESGLLRVGGRLRLASIPEDRKHPMILPRHGPLTELIVRHFHIKNLHAAPQLLLASLRQEFWILYGRDVVRLCVKKCGECFRQNPIPFTQAMGNLPPSKVSPSPPFQKCGVDYAGPLALRVLKGRGQKRFKAYIALFVCFVTHAIHLELVTDLTTDAFIAALKRFIARRGKCSDMHSDCGTNFVGAKKELKELYDLATSPIHNQLVSHFMTSEGINWHLNPPAAPHFGGIWEAGVKSVKYHLKRVAGNADLNYEEMLTTLTQVEACVNSRPLTPMSSDPNDLSALTPGHFLIGRPLTAIVEPDYTEIKVNRLSRWQLTQQLTQHFWRRWSSEYLAQLLPRSKWSSATPNLKIGDLVLVKEDNLPKQKWRLGRIITLHPGKDNLVRVVTIKTIDGELKRPVVKLCPLPLDTE